MRVSSSLSTGVVLVLLVTLVFAGCSGTTTHKYEGPTGQVKGKVTFKGDPVTTGQVQFISAVGGATGDLGEGGAFTLSYRGAPDIPVGRFKVAIKPPRTGAEAGENAATTVKHPMIPEKYQLTSTSELVESVKEGENTVNLNME